MIRLAVPLFEICLLITSKVLKIKFRAMQRQHVLHVLNTDSWGEGGLGFFFRGGGVLELDLIFDTA